MRVIGGRMGGRAEQKQLFPPPVLAVFTLVGCFCPRRKLSSNSLLGFPWPAWV